MFPKQKKSEAELHANSISAFDLLIRCKNETLKSKGFKNVKAEGEKIQTQNDKHTYRSIFFLIGASCACMAMDSFISVFVLMESGHVIRPPPPPQNSYVALTRPKFENWVGRSIKNFFFLRTVRELSFPIFFLQVSKWGKLGRNAVKTHIQVLFLGHWIQILANSSPKSDIKKKNRPCFFAVYGHQSGEGNIIFFFWPYEGS